MMGHSELPGDAILVLIELENGRGGRPQTGMVDR
jgi:hypothetical protein